MVNIKAEIKQARASSPPLTFTAVLMLAAFVVSVPGIFLDSRIITGMPAWLKPAKFAISTAIYSGTLAWLFRYIQIWPRFVKAMGWLTSVVLILEVALIDVQAARGATSHFNVATPLDAAVFSVMGLMIALLWLAGVGILAASFRQTFRDPVRGWSLRLGLLITVLGSATGGMMIRPTAEQADAMRHHRLVTTVGAHTVGAPDGGPGLPGVGWSSGHGDVRVAHFFGLHGLQVIPFLGWLISGSRRRTREQIQLVFTAAASYAAGVAILAWQALRGQSLMEPDSLTLLAFAIWLVATLSAVLVVRKAPIEALA